MSDLAVWLLGFATGAAAALAFSRWAWVRVGRRIMEGEVRKFKAETKPFLDGLKRIAAKQEELSKDT
jgi:hypothetical protein